MRTNEKGDRVRRWLVVGWLLAMSLTSKKKKKKKTIINMILIVALPQHVLYRWLATGLLYLIYAVRVYLLQGWYIVTYGLALYLLNLLIGFLSPQVRKGIFLYSLLLHLFK
jgi:hypothetical protein